MDTGKGEWVLSSKGTTGFKQYSDSINWTVRDEFVKGVGLTAFYHVTTYDLYELQIVAMEGDKEFGTGFYTLGSDITQPYEIIGRNWFEIKQGRFDWHVVAFSIETDKLLTALCNKQDDLKEAIRFYLNNSTGYPLGGANPNAEDLITIDNINRKTKVLIFPHTKITEVAFGPEKETRCWNSYTEQKLGGGDYVLVLGPQQPDYMMQYRQYTWTPGWGVFIINSGMRSYAYCNYTHKPDGSRKSKGGKWPDGYKVVVDLRYKTT